MLPFLKPKTIAGLIISHRKPDGGKEEDHSEGNEGQPLEAAAEDILRAIAAKDAQHLALALRAAFDIMESEEGCDDDEDDNSFDSQNQKAAAEEQE